jgi:hypothetical protein
LKHLGTTIQFFLLKIFLYQTLFVAPLHRRPLQNATISKMKSDNFKTLKKGEKQEICNW